MQLLAADDGGDPARYRAALQDLVENKKVLAFVNNFQALTGSSGVDYLNAKQIPVIGLTGAEVWADRSGMFFAQLPVGRQFVNSVLASHVQQALVAGKKRFGLLGCAEVQLCKLALDAAEEEVAKRGMTLAYKAQISLAQPEFTAECLSAQNAKVETLAIFADGNTVRRVAASCGRQGYKPQFATGSQAVDDSMLEDPNLDGLIANSTTAPWFQSDTPVTAEYVAVMKQYNLRPAGIRAQAWAAMKIVEHALSDMSEPPTSAAILEGLYRIQKSDTGGMTTPVSYAPGRFTNQPLCWWNVAIQKGAWVSPNGYRRTCDQ